MGYIMVKEGAMKARTVVLLGKGKRLFEFAFALSRLMRAYCIVPDALEGEPFLVGKRIATCLAPRVFAYPFLFIGQDHALTGGVVAGLMRRTSVLPYLLVLDAHLDLFASREVSFPIHRGNFLAYLLRREGFPEDRLFVCSSFGEWSEIRRQLFALPPGFLYLSWDVDFGFPEIAHFPSGVTSEHLEEIFADLALLSGRQGFRFLGGDLVELDHRKVVDPLSMASRVSSCLRPIFEEAKA
jgi:arginase family enzyme